MTRQAFAKSPVIPWRDPVDEAQEVVRCKQHARKKDEEACVPLHTSKLDSSINLFGSRWVVCIFNQTQSASIFFCAAGRPF
jgi:hypothetical protein